MRASDEILLRVTDGYRKLRNTARFALGNPRRVDPERDSVPVEESGRDRSLGAGGIDLVTKKVLAAYEAYEFHNVYQALFNFATVTLSVCYFDIP